MKKQVVFFILLWMCTGVILYFSCSTLGLKSQGESAVNVIPRPMSAQLGDGQFILTPQTKILIENENPAVHEVAAFFARQVEKSTGFKLVLENSALTQAAPGTILLTTKNAAVKLGVEGYALTANSSHVTLSAPQPAGLFYGIQTLFQLLPPEILGNSVATGIEWSLPAVTIEDQPRYSWRGMHLDVCRHFFPTDFVKKYIDLIALHKMNRFHWHLTEDQGWRIEIEKYPGLTEIGAWRADRTGVTWNQCKPQQPGEKATYGGFYTKAEIREIIEYARERQITIIPEIEMPGHALAALAAYPQFSCTGGPFTVATGGYWPIVDVFCPGNDSTFEFFENVLTEVIELFPSEYIHIGADEVNKLNWKTCPKCQARIQAEGLKTEEELQSYFVKRIEKFLVSKNKKLIGWDEILEGGLAPEATVMSWRGISGGIQAAKEGHDVIMSPTSHCYFDYYQDHPDDEPEAIGGYLPLEKVYEYEPTPAELNPEEQKYILGAQANIWTEYIPTPEHAEFMALPRMSALAEVVWSPKNARNLQDFYRRMAAFYLRLDALEVNYRQPELIGFHRNNVFIDSLKLVIEKPRPYAEIHFTLDDSEPTAESARYTQPILITENTVLKAREFLPNGKTGQVKVGYFKKQTPRPATELTTKTAGLLVNFYPTAQSIKTVATLDSLAAAETLEIEKFEFPAVPLPEEFGLIFTGYLQVPETGLYTFTVASNDDSRLFIGENLVVDNDGPHGVLERTGQVALAAGWHPVKLAYFQAGGSKELFVTYQGPGIEKTEIPTPVLVH
jgi:hexosaminidase